MVRLPPNIFRIALSSLFVVAMNSRALGQTPELEVFYRKLDPKDQFKYKWKDKEAVCTAGVFRWEVPAREFGTNGLDRNFTGYCAEVLVPITANKLYRFQVNSLFAPENYGLAEKDGAAAAAQRRATFIKELFGRYYRDPTEKSVNPDEALALQIALWEVIQESEPAQGIPKLDLFSGDFQANYLKTDAPAFVLKAQEYLDSLTGDDSPFYSNPDLRGRELIRLKGVPNASGIVAQSQFALRYAGGGAVGSAGLSRILTNTGSGILLGGIGGTGFGSGLGSGTGAGGGGGFVTNGSGGSGTTTDPDSSTTTSSNSSTNNSTTNPPTGGPITVPPVDGPPSTTPPDGTNPVPAPAGFLLGAIALGTLGSWRVGVRLLSSR
jgi:hypothetical protein